MLNLVGDQKNKVEPSVGNNRVSDSGRVCEDSAGEADS